MYIAVKKDIRVARTRQALIDAMRDLLETRRFDAITVNDLCIQACVSRTTFYQHFEDKYDLVLAWINTEIKPPSELFADATMEQYFRQLMHAEYHYRKQMRNLLQNGDNSELQWRIIDMWSRGFERYYREKQRQGARLEAPCRMMATYNCAGLVSVSWWLFLNDFPCSEEQVVEYMLRKVRQSGELIHL